MNLLETPLGEILRDLSFAGQTGVLAVTRESTRKEVYLLQGAVVYAASNAEEDRMERVLLKWGLLDREHLAAAVDRCKQEGRSMKDVLVESGVVSEESLADFTSAVMQERVWSLFLWQDGQAEWKDLTEDHVRTDAAIRVSTPNLILEGIRRMLGFERVRTALVEVNPVLRPQQEPRVSWSDLRLHPSEGYVYSCFNGTADLRAIIALSPLSEDETCRLAYGFLVLDLLRPLEVSDRERGRPFSIRSFQEHEGRSAERAEEIKGKIRAVYKKIGDLKDHEILGVRPESSLDEIQEAFRKVSEKYKLERFSPAVRKECRTELEIIGARIAESYLGLQERAMSAIRGQRGPFAASSSVARPRRSKAEIEAARKEAEDFATACLKRADDAARIRDYHTAIDFVQQAIRRLPDVAQYHARLGELLEKNPKWHKRAEDSYARAIDLDGDEPSFKVALAQLYKRFNMQSKALRLFEEALLKDPTNQEILAEVKALKGQK